jgi:hypothetical protein
MHAKLLGLLLAGLVGLAGWSGCATPATRIEANPEVYARLSDEEKALVRAGKVAIGFSAGAVKLALGDPDRVAVRTDADGQTEIWHYLTYEARGRILFTGHFHTGRLWWGGMYPYYLRYPDRTVRDRFTVHLRNGRVTAIVEDRGR